MQVQLEKKKIMKWIANQILIMNKILIVNNKLQYGIHIFVHKIYLELLSLD